MQHRNRCVSLYSELIFRTAFLIAALLLFNPAANAITCAEINGAYVYSQESIPVYLGFFGTSTASESINNSFGAYGSEFSSTSVRNEFGQYGSQFGSYSAQNDFASSPPEIYKWGELVGYLTTRSLVSGGVSLAAIDASCSPFATFAYDLPFFVPNVQASDGISLDTVILTWDPAPGADFYAVYQSDTQSSEKIFLGTTVSTSAEID